MPREFIARYLNPWMFQREEKRRRFAALRERDGDNCWRCRRPMDFELPRGHDLAPTIEHLQAKSKGGTMELGNLCLCHGRCNRLMGDATLEVKERMRAREQAEAELARTRKAVRRRKAA
jgi:hypothetical protein